MDWTLLLGHWWRLLVIALCLGALAFSSLAEAALMRLEPSRVRHLLTAGGRRSRQLAALAEHRQEVLSSLVLLINVAIIITSAYVTELTIKLSGESTRWVAASSAGMIVFILVVCEVAPKTYGVRRAERVGLLLAPALRAVHLLIRPLGQMLHRMALSFNRRVLVPVLGGRATPAAPLFSDEEVLEIVSAGEAEGGIEEDEKEMIHGVIEFADKVAREVMTPRTDVVSVAAKISLAEAAGVCTESGYSRLPVYTGTLDHVIGIAYAKDMVSALEAGAPEARATSVGEIARKPAPVVPESKRLDELLTLMQRNRVQMAIVIDEYGGTAGVVTIEDVLEEIFGEIQDEHDLGAEPIQAVSEGVWVVSARASVDEVADELGVERPEGEFDSIGGFILDQLGRMPVAGERLRWRDLELIVEAVSENRIQEVRVIRRPENGRRSAAEEGADDETAEGRR